MLEISVILPTHNHARMLPTVLDGFGRQTLPQSQFEIVVVDDGSTDDTGKVWDCARATLPVRVFRQRHAGWAAARNLGPFASRASILLFVDEDKVPGRDYLLNHLLAHRANPEPQVAILGQTQLATTAKENPLMRHVTQVGDQLFSYHAMKPGFMLGTAPFRGGTSCKRQFLLDHGIFNSVFALVCDDIEFGYRSQKFGLQVRYEPDAAATMIGTFSFHEFCRRQQQLGRSERTCAELHRTSEVHQYCQIDQALSFWKERGKNFSQYVRWVERLDKMAKLRAQCGQPLRSADQAYLDEAYRAAFALCRAKGIVRPDVGGETL